jgi:thymidylate synthase (FAD)
VRAVVIAQTQTTQAFWQLCEEFGYSPDFDKNGFSVWRAAQQLAEFAGRLCYKSWSKPNPATATNAGYIENLKDHKHFSVLEHGSVSFYFDGISRNLTHELVRHRHFSFSQVSQRYVDDYESEVIIPAAVNGYLRTNTIQSHLKDSKEIYKQLVWNLRQDGYPKKKAQQAARFILPGSTETAIVVTGNHRSWREFVDKRYSEFADPEIRDLAGLVLTELRSIAPDIYSDFEDKEF